MGAPPRPEPTATTGDHIRFRIGALIASASIEISPRDEWAGPPLRELFPAGLEVFVNHSGSVTPHDIVAACVRLRRAGFEPVPHVAARRLASFAQADDFLRRAAGEAQINAILLIGGDAEPPVGPFRDSLGFWQAALSSDMAFGGSRSRVILRAIRRSARMRSTRRSRRRSRSRAGSAWRQAS